MAIKFFDAKTLSKAQLESGKQFAPKFDENGLVSAIAQDYKSGEILMLAHMNEQALSLTLETNEVHYFSRSRQKIWKKGEISGEVQKLIKMQVDCDQDAILLKVEQLGIGAACHTGRKSCFFRSVEINGEETSLKLTGGEQLFDPKDKY
ncbi:MAG: phosphoribosyl-AMP cyclohydrolase [Devosiaceae bacterium]|nr:phosphoribosyl-AMP cyclohydrolase [Devosiaceae bacterium]